jgi:hypothetical protein
MERRLNFPMNSETIVTEIVTEEQPANAKLALIVKENQLPAEDAASLQKTFLAFLGEIDTYQKQATAIKVTDASQKPLMAMARAARLGVKALRVKADHAREDMKQESIRKGRAIQAAYTLVEYACTPLEDYFLEQEQFAERQEAKRKAALKEVRSGDLLALGADPSLYALGEMTEETWQQLISGLKYAKEQAAEAARKAEADRIAKEAAELAAREAQRLENERLKKEAAEKEIQLKAEREAAAKAAKDAAEAARKEKARLQSLADAERKKAETARLAAEEKARKEREVIEAKAKAEREAREKAEADLAKAREQAAEVAGRLLAEAQALQVARKAKEEAERVASAKAAAAPDKEKLVAFAASVRALPVPTLTTVNGKAAAKKLAEQVTKFAEWIEAKAGTLEELP